MAEPFVGEIRMFGGNYAPEGWFLCAGQQLSIADYEVLYALIGTTYGGNGTTTFGLPDLRGKLPVGQGQGPGLTARAMGQSIGVNEVTLTSGQLPAHNHVIQATANLASTVTPGPGLTLATVAQPPSTTTFYDTGTANPPGKNAFSSSTLSKTGNGLPHSNQMPTLSINYIIAYQGIFPQQG